MTDPPLIHDPRQFWDALCLAEGEGRNAVFLAERGHRVTIQDLSLQTHCGDLQKFEPEPGSTDLVVAIWMHLPPRLRAVVQVLGRKP